MNFRMQHATQDGCVWRESKEIDAQVLALKTAEEALKDAMYANGHDRKRQRTEPSVPGLDMTDDEDEACAGHLYQCKRRWLPLTLSC